MAYNRKNLLQRIIDIQEIYREHQKNGATDRWIYKNRIEPRYRISERTFYTYLTTSARRELEKLKQAEEAQMEIHF